MSDGWELKRRNEKVPSKTTGSPEATGSVPVSILSSLLIKKKHEKRSVAPTVGPQIWQVWPGNEQESQKGQSGAPGRNFPKMAKNALMRATLAR